ncbi:MAG: hypothetical protein ABI668_12560 [Sphingorhabdus sp.]
MPYMPNTSNIERTFQDIPDDKTSEADQTAFLMDLGWYNGSKWDDLLQSARVLIISEAGAGKTYECRERQIKMWNAGEPAFYLELADLSRSSVQDMLSHEENIRFDAWLNSQSDIATFFLDSIDELKLSLGSFEQALKRLNRAVAGQLARIKVVITTRPIPIDEQLFREILPIPPKPEDAATSEEFADIVMGRVKTDDKDKDAPKPWRNVALMPLSDSQIRQMAKLQGVPDIDGLVNAIRQHNAEEFARRPQDLIELCADWRDHRRIRTHREQVESNIAIKLKPRADRLEKVALSSVKAWEGASRLALAALLTRKLTLRHSVEADRHGDPAEAPLDPANILPEWSADERTTLLERPLFGFASYGRVRFHHRSVIEYLAAHRIGALRDRGMPFNAVKRLLFTSTAQGDEVIRPSMLPVAAWAAGMDDAIFAEALRREPSALLDAGDPESLRLDQKKQALRAYVERYGKGGWRGLRVPHVQVHRFATKELGPEIESLWKGGIENSEVHELLLGLIGAGQVLQCADIAHAIVVDHSISDEERLDGLQALIALNDSRLDAITAEIAATPEHWSNRLTRYAIVRLFPAHLAPERLCKILVRVSEKKRSVGDISWHLPRIIEQSNLQPQVLESLRHGFTELITEGLAWNEGAWPQISSKRYFLISALASTCLSLLKHGVVSPDVLRSAIVALRLNDREYNSSDSCKHLRQFFGQAEPTVRQTMFLTEDAFLMGLRPQLEAYKRYARIAHHGAINLRLEDAKWVLELLSDQARTEEERAFILEAAIRLRAEDVQWLDHLTALKGHVSDLPALTAWLDERSKPAERDEEWERMERESEMRRVEEEKRKARNRASWTKFWQEVANQPDTVFSAGQSADTAWGLWRAMERTGDSGRSSAWNRRFIERHFGKDVADRLRIAIMAAWRNDRPTLRSEREEGEKGTYLVRWQLGLAGIVAEAEDAHWAEKLNHDEAQLAARYAPMELNGYPVWLEALIKTHPSAVDAVLGAELTAELADAPVEYSIMLQNVQHAPLSVAKLFVPRLRAWLDAATWRTGTDKQQNQNYAQRLRQVLDILLRVDDIELTEHVRHLAAKELSAGPDDPLAHVWLPVLFRLDPEAATGVLEQLLTALPAAKFGAATDWFSGLFGERHSSEQVSLSHDGFTPDVLVRLIRLAYQHVRIDDDMKLREGVYTPNVRDHAERARNHILEAIISAEGPEAWVAKLAMAQDPLFDHFKDRLMALARERSAQESDVTAFCEGDVIKLDRYGELPPLTRDDMFLLMMDRLDDIGELLLRDDSPRGAWGLIADEHLMRQQIARELRTSSNSAYTVNQEAVTADEKETDIRLCSIASDHEAVIELKLGDKPRSGAVLRAAIKDQLVTKYMAPQSRKSGCLLITISGDREWDHPDTGDRLNFQGLIQMLRDEAAMIEQQMAGGLRLAVYGLDLRPRLATERQKSDNKK